MLTCRLLEVVIQLVSPSFLMIDQSLGLWFGVGWDPCPCAGGFYWYHGLFSLEGPGACSHPSMRPMLPHSKICGQKRQCLDIKHLTNSFQSPVTPTSRKFFLKFSLNPSCFHVSSFPLVLSKTEIGNSCSPSTGSYTWGLYFNPAPKPSSLLQNKHSSSQKHSLRQTQTMVANYFLRPSFNSNLDPRYCLSFHSWTAHIQWVMQRPKSEDKAPANIWRGSTTYGYIPAPPSCEVQSIVNLSFLLAAMALFSLLAPHTDAVLHILCRSSPSTPTATLLGVFFF